MFHNLFLLTFANISYSSSSTSSASSISSTTSFPQACSARPDVVERVGLVGEYYFGGQEATL
jgi:hypothetical protein